MDKEQYCNAFNTWAKLMKGACVKRDNLDLRSAISSVELAVSKSCLLDRMINLGLQPSQTPCPVHEGFWSGINGRWPGTYSFNFKTREQRPMPEDKWLRKQYDQGCRCFLHGCGCTTGWQPDEHSGASYVFDISKFTNEEYAKLEKLLVENNYKQRKPEEHSTGFLTWLLEINEKN